MSRRVTSSKQNSGDTFDFNFATDVHRYADKAVYATNGVIFTIRLVEYQPKHGYNGTDRWALTVTHRDARTTEIITLPSNKKRDEQLRAAKKHIDAKGPIPNVRLVRAGTAYYFRPAEAQIS